MCRLQCELDVAALLTVICYLLMQLNGGLIMDQVHQISGYWLCDFELDMQLISL